MLDMILILSTHNLDYCKKCKFLRHKEFFESKFEYFFLLSFYTYDVSKTVTFC